MKVRPDQIERHLKNQLAAIYFICGDEPLQVMESADRIRAEARKQNYTEREVMDVDAQFDWNLLLDAGNSLSLFAEKRILELRLPTGKPGKVGSKVLQEYAQRPADDAILIISSGKLESSSKNTKWFKTLDQQGVVIQCWPVNADQLPQWINQRLQSKGLTADNDAVQLLADRVEGNLLAAAQEVDKLFLLYGAGKLNFEQTASAVANSSRYNIYDLVDTALAGNVTRTSRIIGGLKNEGVEPVLMLWALSREVRMIAKISEANVSPDAAMAKLRVWENRKALIRKALSRHRAPRWKLFLKRCAKIDKVIKGVEPGRAWDELLMLSTQIAQ
ncbi:DNA polymerase III delta subunit [hydrothermal vent metagenome]|uniref:DNA polymerase III subunit delta n=1 Tax=hydrothermal vent metagenome TaxID=652676 RepID=A0A3B0XBE3_9ZZZZ